MGSSRRLRDRAWTVTTISMVALIPAAYVLFVSSNAVYLGVSNGGDRILRASQTSLSANTTTNVVLCLWDANLAPLPTAFIDYAIGPTGSATVTVNGSGADSGVLQTDANGCTTATVSSSGQMENSPAIPVVFDTDGLALPLQILIKSPGAGNLGATIGDSNPGDTGEKRVTLQLLGDDGTAIADTRITDEVTVEDKDNSCDGFPPRQNVPAAATVTYDPATQLTDAQGRLVSLVDVRGDNGDLITVKYTSFGGAITEVKFPVVQDDLATCAEGALQLKVFPEELAPNDTTVVNVCLEDSKQRPIPGSTIRYAVGPTGGAQVLVGGSNLSQGTLQSDDSGCASTPISSSGVIDGTKDDKIEIRFVADNAEEAAVVSILPLEGVLSGTVEGNEDSPKVVDLKLVDRRTGQPIAGSFIAYGPSDGAACVIEDVTFDPIDQRTNAEGKLKATFQTGEAPAKEDETPKVQVTFTSSGGAQFKADLSCQVVDDGGGGGDDT